ncbi:MAG: hypothetical protein P4L84_22020 [Isosphaeraceae bacterium]|nr:hypothetical protein [Isosphaeraceae bacterium]
MRIPRFRIRTLMMAIARIALLLWLIRSSPYPWPSLLDQAELAFSFFAWALCLFVLSIPLWLYWIRYRGNPPEPK